MMHTWRYTFVLTGVLLLPGCAEQVEYYRASAPSGDPANPFQRCTEPRDRAVVFTQLIGGGPKFFRLYIGVPQAEKPDVDRIIMMVDKWVVQRALFDNTNFRLYQNWIEGRASYRFSSDTVVLRFSDGRSGSAKLSHEIGSPTSVVTPDGSRRIIEPVHLTPGRDGFVGAEQPGVTFQMEVKVDDFRGEWVQAKFPVVS
jgi:hypothetical protein